VAFVTFSPAVFLAAMVGGFWPGVLATFLSALSIDYFVIAPTGSMILTKTSDDVGMGVFLATGMAVSVMSEMLRRAEKRAEEKNALLAAIVLSSEDAIVSKTLDGIITSWNRGAQNLLGYTPEEVIGRHISLIIPPEHAHEEPRILDRLRKGEVVEHFETQRAHKDGHLIQASITISPMRDHNGAVIGGSKILRDVSDRKRADEKFRLVVEAAPNAMVMIHQDGRIALINAQTEQAFGYTREELLGQPVEVLLPERFRDAHPGHRSGFFARPDAIGASVRSMGLGRDLYGRRKDGSEFPIEVGLNPIRTEQGLMVLSAIIDISERKRLETNVREFNRVLEIQVSERTAELRYANQELEEFAYVASHDLKAPLRVIDNCSRWMAEDLEEHLSEESRENMALLRGRVKRMEKLLDDLLAYARIGRVTDARYIETISGDTLMRNILELLATEGFEVKVSPSFAAIQVNPMPLQQVLMNLISNAIKHHDKRTGCIEVMVEDRGTMYAFAVKDDGPGIPARFHEQIFKMFQTLRPRDQVEGSGMGLAMVRKHIEVFGGTLNLESEEGKGSTFRFTWPKEQHMRGEEGATHGSILQPTN